MRETVVMVPVGVLAKLLDGAGGAMSPLSDVQAPIRKAWLAGRQLLRAGSRRAAQRESPEGVELREAAVAWSRRAGVRSDTDEDDELDRRAWIRLEDAALAYALRVGVASREVP